MKPEDYLAMVGGDPQAILTREKLLKGKTMTQDIPTSVGVFTIRPLDLGEQASVAAMLVKGVKIKGQAETMARQARARARGQEAEAGPDMEMDMEQTIANQWSMKFQTLAYGLSAGKEARITLAEVKEMNLPSSVVNELVSAIRSLSGMEATEGLEEVKSFLESTRSVGDKDGGPSGDTPNRASE